MTKFLAILSLVIVVLFSLAACSEGAGPTAAPLLNAAPIPTAAPASVETTLVPGVGVDALDFDSAALAGAPAGVSEGEIIELVEAALEARIPEGVSAEEIQSVLESAMSEAAQSNLSVDDVQAVVAQAMEQAMAAEEESAMEMAATAATPAATPTAAPAPRPTATAAPGSNLIIAGAPGTPAPTATSVPRVTGTPAPTPTPAPRPPATPLPTAGGSWGDAIVHQPSRTTYGKGSSLPLKTLFPLSASILTARPTTSPSTGPEPGTRSTPTPCERRSGLTPSTTGTNPRCGMTALPSPPMSSNIHLTARYTWPALPCKHRRWTTMPRL